MTGDRRYIVTATGFAVLIAAIGVSVIYNDQPATDAGKSMSDAANKTVQAARSARPEYAPRVADTVPGDGTWIIGRDIKRGRYRTVGGLSCLWQRMVPHPSGRWVTVDSGYGWAPQTVALGKDDVAFVSQGCEPWVMVP